MSEFQLELSPLYSKLADPSSLTKAESDKIPHDYRELRQHQLETWRAYNDPDIDVIFDTALTGDGKSLAGQLPMLTNDKKAFLMYPTNELIEDQLGQVEKYVKAFKTERKYSKMYGDEITRLMEEQGFDHRRSQVLSLFREHSYILSNPDLFHLMSSYNYGGFQDKREYAYEVPANFDYFVFDEFHIFGPPQIVSVLNALNYHKVIWPNRKLKYIFLSATPTKTFKRLLDNSGFRIKTVEGHYSATPESGYSPNPIVQKVDLHLHSLSEKGAFVWAEEHLQELIDFYRANPESKGVFIVNSVATAKRLTKYYKQELEERGIVKVAENTGLTNRKQREEARSKEFGLVIATSTVDVGVDFDINLLIFESSSAGTFIQRLGRLGRHEGYANYRAYALLPDWLASKFAGRFKDSSSPIERTEFLRAVRGDDETSVNEKDETASFGSIFPTGQEYKHYASQWGRLQTAHVIYSAEGVGLLGKPKWSDSARELREQYNQMYGGKPTIGGWVYKYEQMLKTKEDDETTGQHKVLDELNTFRGRSPLNCGIIDETDGYPKNYDLFFLLANTSFEPIDEEEFKREIEKHNKRQVEKRKVKFEDYASRELKLYVRLKEYKAERDNFVLLNTRSFKKRLHKVCVFDDFTIADSCQIANHLDNSVNNRLAELALVCMVVDGKPAEFKRRNRLNPMFPVYAVRDKDKLPLSVIFGLDAMLANSLVFWKKDAVPDELPIC